MTYQEALYEFERIEQKLDWIDERYDLISMMIENGCTVRMIFPSMCDQDDASSYVIDDLKDLVEAMMDMLKDRGMRTVQYRYYRWYQYVHANDLVVQC